MLTQVLISVINYGNEEDVLAYARHLSRQKGKGLLSLAVVGNRWSEHGMEYLKGQLESIDLDVHVYDPQKNLGYLNGALFGYTSFAEETGCFPAWVAVSNTDIEYDGDDFYERFLRAAESYRADTGCVAPSVHSAATGAYENPRYLRRFTRGELEKRIRIQRSGVLSGIYQRLSALKAGFVRGAKKDSAFVYLAHGSFFLLRRSLADALCASPYSALLYSEEAYVAETAIQQGMRVWYDSELQITHCESAVTGKLNNPERAAMYVDSLTMICNQFYSTDARKKPFAESDICALVVSYNGADRLERNLHALCPQAAQVVVVDNGSDEETLRRLEHLQNEYSFVLLKNGENMGIGAALQQGLAYAHGHGFRLLLTMDQDSELGESAAAEMMRVMNSNASAASVGPEYGMTPPEGPRTGSYPVEYLITSGNLVDVNAAFCAGGYNEGLFIDSVDFDFSLRMRENGYLLRKAPGAFMKHGIGEKTSVRFLCFQVNCRTHSPVRHYYMSRNHVYICKRYAKEFKLFCLKKRIAMAGNVISTLLLHPNRKENFAMMRKGKKDAKKGIFGKFKS